MRNVVQETVAFINTCSKVSYQHCDSEALVHKQRCFSQWGTRLNHKRAVFKILHWFQGRLRGIASGMLLLLCLLFIFPRFYKLRVLGMPCTMALSDFPRAEACVPEPALDWHQYFFILLHLSEIERDCGRDNDNGILLLSTPCVCMSWFWCCSGMSWGFFASYPFGGEIYPTKFAIFVLVWMLYSPRDCHGIGVHESVMYAHSLSYRSGAEHVMEHL